MKNILALLTVVAMTGCMGVPKTRITYNPGSNTIEIESPKEIGFTNLSASFPTPNGTAMISITGYSSRNNAAIINAVAKANANYLKSVGQASGEMLGEVAEHLK